jgi:putative endonuclease
MNRIKAWLNQLKPRTISQPLFRHPSEEWAANWLQERGLILLAWNFQVRGGEIDLVMQDKQVLVFVEVRYRQNRQYGSAAETIDSRKQQKLLKTAQYYLQQTGKTHSQCRFDVVSIDHEKDNSLTWQWHQNAFNEY